MSKSTPKSCTNILKYVSLATLALQAAILTLSLRYARTRQSKEDLFFSSTAIVMAESTKLFLCLVVVFLKSEGSLDKFGATMFEMIFRNGIDTVKVCFPSLLYVVQNNLLYLAISNLDAVTFLVTNRLKILTAAIFAMIILRKKLLITQWISFVIMIVGIVLTQMSVDENVSKHGQNQILGLSSAFCASVLSGFSGIFLEKMFKNSEISLWMRNIQMSLVGIPIVIMTCLATNYNDIWTKGFFHGYDWFVVYIVILQASSGLIVAMVLKYASNILKEIASTFSIIIASIASAYFFDLHLNSEFVIGVILVIFSTFLYTYAPKSEVSETVNLDRTNTEIIGIDNNVAEIDEKNTASLEKGKY